MLVLREGATADHPSWALVLYTRAAVIASNLMFLVVLALVILVCKAGPPLGMGELIVHFWMFMFFMSSGILIVSLPVRRLETGR